MESGNKLKIVIIWYHNIASCHYMIIKINSIIKQFTVFMMIFELKAQVVEVFRQW